MYSVMQLAMKITVCSDSKFPFNNWRSSNSQSDSISISAPVGPYTGQGTGSVCLNPHLATKSQTICLSIWEVYQITDSGSNSDANLNLTHNSYAETTLIKTALIISFRLLTKVQRFFPGQEQANWYGKWLTTVSFV